MRLLAPGGGVQLGQHPRLVREEHRGLRRLPRGHVPLRDDPHKVGGEKSLGIVDVGDLVKVVAELLVVAPSLLHLALRPDAPVVLLGADPPVDVVVHDPPRLQPPEGTVTQADRVLPPEVPELGDRVELRDALEIELLLEVEGVDHGLPLGLQGLALLHLQGLGRDGPALLVRQLVQLPVHGLALGPSGRVGRHSNNFHADPVREFYNTVLSLLRASRWPRRSGRRQGRGPPS